MENNKIDLVVAHKNGKCAIFNTANSEFLTKHEFDGIKLSNWGYHIVYKAKDLIDEEGKLFKNQGDITYSAVIDNNGKVKEFDNLKFGYYGTFVEDVCPAYNTKTKKVHLVNYNKGIISEGFGRILPVNQKNNFGIYYGLDKNKKNRAWFEVPYKFKSLLYKDGTIIPLSLKIDDGYWAEGKSNELLESKTLIQMLRKYGANILELAPIEIFDKLKTYLDVIKIINQKHPNQILYTIELLTQKVYEANFVHNKDIKLEIEVNGENQIAANYNKKKIVQFLDLLASKKH